MENPVEHPWKHPHPWAPVKKGNLRESSLASAAESFGESYRASVEASALIRSRERNPRESSLASLPLSRTHTLPQQESQRIFPSIRNGILFGNLRTFREPFEESRRASVKASTPIGTRKKRNLRESSLASAAESFEESYRASVKASAPIGTRKKGILGNLL